MNTKQEENKNNNNNNRFHFFADSLLMKGKYFMQ